MDCFVIRGFGEKKNSQGTLIDFDRVDQELIKPAMEKCGLFGGTTAVVQGSGAIHQDMFQLILAAAIVICDITVHNPNVFYELGVRHTMRKKFTVLIKGSPTDDRAPFDIAGMRYMEYSWADPGKDLQKLIAVINSTRAMDRETDSPIFLMMPMLQQADQSSISAVPPSFTEEVQMARANNDKGRLRLLAEDVGGESFERAGLRLVGREQWTLKDYKVAARTWKKVLVGEENDIEANHALANVHERLYKVHGDPTDLDLSNQAIKRLLGRPDLSPSQRAESLALKGRNLKSLWRCGFLDLDSQEARRERAIHTLALDSYNSYREAYRADLNHFFPGLAALQMGHILMSLSIHARFKNLFGGNERKTARFLENLEEELSALTHVVRAAIERGRDMLKGDDLIWARISAADLLFLDQLNTGPEAGNLAVIDAYRDAVPEGTFFWDAATGQIRLFERLGIGEEAARAILKSLDGPAGQTEQAGYTGKRKPERHLVLFTGHTVDPTGQAAHVPRFPASSHSRARELIKATLEKFRASTDELNVLVSSAPGADILALEVCIELEIQTCLCLPVGDDVLSCEIFKDYDVEWRNRYFKLANAIPPERTFVLSQNGKLPEWLLARSTMTPWSRGSRWILHQALASGADKVTLLALWDHNADDRSPNGTAELIRLAKATDGVYVDVMDCRPLAAS